MDETSSVVDADRPHDLGGEPRPAGDPAGGLPLFDRRLPIESITLIRIGVLPGRAAAPGDHPFDDCSI